MMGLINSIAYVIGYGVIIIICFSIAVLMVAGGFEFLIRMRDCRDKSTRGIVLKNKYSIYEGKSEDGEFVRLMTKTIQEAQEMAGPQYKVHLVEKLPDMKLV